MRHKLKKIPYHLWTTCNAHPISTYIVNSQLYIELGSTGTVDNQMAKNEESTKHINAFKQMYLYNKIILGLIETI